MLNRKIFPTHKPAENLKPFNIWSLWKFWRFFSLARSEIDLKQSVDTRRYIFYYIEHHKCSPSASGKVLPRFEWTNMVREQLTVWCSALWGTSWGDPPQHTMHFREHNICKRRTVLKLFRGNPRRRVVLVIRLRQQIYSGKEGFLGMDALQLQWIREIKWTWPECSGQSMTAHLNYIGR